MISQISDTRTSGSIEREEPAERIPYIAEYIRKNYQTLRVQNASMRSYGPRKQQAPIRCTGAWEIADNATLQKQRFHRFISKGIGLTWFEKSPVYTNKLPVQRIGLHVHCISRVE